MERKNGFVRILCPGGEDIGVEEKHVVYPEIE